MTGPSGIGGPPINPLFYATNQGNQQQQQTQQPQQPQQPAGGGNIPNNAIPVNVPRHGTGRQLFNNFRTLAPPSSGQAYVIDAGDPGGTGPNDSITLDVKTGVSSKVKLQNTKSCAEIIQKLSKDQGDIAQAVYQMVNSVKVT